MTWQHPAQDWWRVVEVNVRGTHLCARAVLEGDDEKGVDLVEDVASGMLDGLSGRYLRAAIDDWRALAAHVNEVNEADAHVLRVRTL
jgi:hypothetical protein